METIWVGMSGGVDSSVAAALLLEQGHTVVGVTLRLREGAQGDVDDARRVCDALDIEHRVIDLTGRFSGCVMDEFAREYRAGRTPNPCITCNRTIKFGALLDAALGSGADAVATGHYARVEYDPERGRHLLYRVDSPKDQSYVLYSLDQRQLGHARFPIAAMDKQAVRAAARARSLPVAEKGDSMEICFLPDGDYAAFVETRTGSCPPGPFVDEEGRILGTHRGIIHYTVGQRKGLGTAFGRPMYVVRIDPEKNAVVLGEEGRQYAVSLTAAGVRYIPFDRPAGPLRAQVRIRYQAKPADATVYPLPAGRARVAFDRPQRAAAPGQSAVFYDGDLVLGGGIIESTDGPDLGGGRADF